MKYSIIIPVYNVEKYIKRCLDSVVNQNYDDYEVIVVDDESPDNSMEIVEAYAELYPSKIRIVHQRNKGLGGARNTGVLFATGDYILFLDSDDYIHLNTLSVIDSYLRKSPCELMIFSYSEVNEKGELLKEIKFPEYLEGYTSTIEKPEILLTPTAAWNKVYLRRFYLDVDFPFPEKTLYEDGVTRFLTAKATSICFCNEHLYYYVQRNSSIMHQKISERMFDIFKVTDLVLEKFKRDGIYAQAQEVIDAALLDGILGVFDIINESNYNHSYQEYFSEYVVRVFSDFQKNRYISGSMKQSIAYIVRRKYKKYNNYKYVIGIKRWLLQNPIVSKCNVIYKKLRK